MSISLLGLGTAVPEHTMSLAEATALAHAICNTADERQHRVLDVFYRKSGVQNRNTCLPHRIALTWLAEGNVEENSLNVATATTLGPTTQERIQFYEEHAFPLARDATALALAAAQVAPEEITHLVTVSCTGFYSPGVDVQLIQHFGLHSTVERVHVGFMGCHGAINGLRVSNGLGALHPNARILLCAVELCSLHYRFQWDPERFIGNALFADGAGALILGSPSQPGNERWRLQATGSCLIPNSTDAMTWKIGDHGFEMTLSAKVPELIKEHLQPWLSTWLHAQGTSIEAIGAWAVHPGGPRILDAVEESLALPSEALAVSRQVLSNCGNMSSPTVLFILQRLSELNTSGPCLLLGFGPGLVAEVALFS